MRVDGKVVEVQGLTVDPTRERIEVDGRRVTLEPLTYLLFNKPREVVCTMQDPAGRPSVADYIRNVGRRVVPVGRLDYQTSGVLLLTNDGDLARALLHPSRGVLKEYVLKVKGRVDAGSLEKLRASIQIDGRATRPARVNVDRTSDEATWLEVVLHEGKNRQVRRLAEHAGYRVMRLSRRRFAGLGTAGLAPGQWRELTAAEVRQLRAAVERPALEDGGEETGAPAPARAKPGPRLAKMRDSRGGSRRPARSGERPRRPSSAQAGTEKRRGASPARATNGRGASQTRDAAADRSGSALAASSPTRKVRRGRERSD